MQFHLYAQPFFPVICFSSGWSSACDYHFMIEDIRENLNHSVDTYNQPIICNLNPLLHRYPF